MNDGKIIRINIPPLTTERRRELVKIVRRWPRNPRSRSEHSPDANEMIKDLKKEKEISEDDQFRAQEETQNITDELIKRIDTAYTAKEKEILEI